MAAGNLWLCFMVWYNWRLCCTVGGSANLPPYLGETIELTPCQYIPLAEDPNQAELPAKFPGKIGQLAWLCRWTELLDEISNWGALKAEANTLVLIAVSTAPSSISI